MNDLEKQLYRDMIEYIEKQIKSADIGQQDFCK
ncbi:hypothetical protein K254310026_24900 [Clostridium tetani]|nr:hypothetical protein K254310026_24900 [Clostridium tetani]